MSMYNLKRKIRVKFARFAKGVRYGVWSMKAPKNPQERLILKIVRNVINKDDSVVFYAPDTENFAEKFYAHTKDKKYIIVFQKYSINISNHNYFYTYGISESLGREIINCAYERLERDRVKLEEEMLFNERSFLNDVYTHVTKKSNKNMIEKK